MGNSIIVIKSIVSFKGLKTHGGLVWLSGPESHGASHTWAVGRGQAPTGHHFHGPSARGLGARSKTSCGSTIKYCTLRQVPPPWGWARERRLPGSFIQLSVSSTHVDGIGDLLQRGSETPIIGWQLFPTFGTLSTRSGPRPRVQAADKAATARLLDPPIVSETAARYTTASAEAFACRGDERGRPQGGSHPAASTTYTNSICWFVSLPCAARSAHGAQLPARAYMASH